MTGFTKLYSSILDSSIWCEDLCTRVVWISFMAKADPEGRVLAAPARMASLANVPLGEFQASLRKLLSPDPDSRTPDNDGRRIANIQGGWQILNYELYREMGRSQDRRDYLKHKKRDERAKKRDNEGLSTAVNSSQQCQPIAEAEAKAKAKAEKRTTCANQLHSFQSVWAAYPKKKGRASALKWWEKHKPDEKLVTMMLQAITAQSKEREDYQRAGQWHAEWPMGSSWLRQERWQDAIQVPQEPASELPLAVNAAGKTPREVFEEEHGH